LKYKQEAGEGTKKREVGAGGKKGGRGGNFLAQSKRGSKKSRGKEEFTNVVTPGRSQLSPQKQGDRKQTKHDRKSAGEGRSACGQNNHRRDDRSVKALQTASRGRGAIRCQSGMANQNRVKSLSEKSRVQFRKKKKIMGRKGGIPG